MNLMDAAPLDVTRVPPAVGLCPPGHMNRLASAESVSLAPAGSKVKLLAKELPPMEKSAEWPAKRTDSRCSAGTGEAPVLLWCFWLARNTVFSIV